jgi:hypothetical protein
LARAFVFCCRKEGGQHGGKWKGGHAGGTVAEGETGIANDTSFKKYMVGWRQNREISRTDSPRAESYLLAGIGHHELDARRPVAHIQSIT